MATITTTITKEENDAAANSSRQCMCEVCTCGSHKCPPRESFKYDPKIKSEYIAKYPGWPVEMRAPYKAAPPRMSDSRMEGDTTYTVDYKAKQIPPKFNRARSGKTLDGCIPDGDYAGSKTEYKDHYIGFDVPPRDPLKQREPAKHPAKFYGITTQRSDFVTWPNSQRAPLKPASQPLDPGEFYGNTTYKANYWDKSKELDRTKELREPKRITNPAKFYDETTYGVGYTPKAVIKTPPMMHTGNLGPSGERFQGDTTYGSNFQDWKVQPIRGPPINNAIKAPPCRFDGNSTYKTDYIRRAREEPCPTLTRAKPTILRNNHLCY